MKNKHNKNGYSLYGNRGLAYNEAVVCWIARWLNQIYPENPKFFIDGLSTRYRSISPFRFYEVFQGEKHIGSREKAVQIFKALFPQFIHRIDISFHKAKYKRSLKDNGDQGSFSF